MRTRAWIASLGFVAGFATGAVAASTLWTIYFLLRVAGFR